MFRVGQKVVMIARLKDRHGYGDECCPTFGEVYTIRDFDHRDAITRIRLEEIVNRVGRYLTASGVFEMEPAFNLSAFRPVKTTSIEIFHRLLAPSGKRKIKTSVVAS